MPCSCRAPALQSSSDSSRPQQHGRREACHVSINNGRLSAACGPPAQLRFLTASAASYTKAVFTSLISHKLNCSWVLPREIPIVIDEEKLAVFFFFVRTRYSSNVFKILSVHFPYTYYFLVSISCGTVKCCDCDGSICAFSHVVFHTEITS